MNLQQMQAINAGDKDVMVFGFADGISIVAIVPKPDESPLQGLGRLLERSPKIEVFHGKIAAAGIFDKGKLTKFSDLSSDEWQAV